MSCTPLAGAEEDVFDLTEVVPETERLDSSLQKAKAQLSIRTRRQRPSRSRLRDSVSSIDGDESCGPVPELLLSSPSSRSRAFTFDPCPLAVDREEQEERRSYKHLLSVSSPESTPRGPSRPASHSETSSPVHVRSGEGSRPLLQRGENSQSEDDGPEEPDSPTVLLDKKTRRRFLDLGVTLRRTYGKVRRDKSSRLSGGHGTENRSSRSSGPPFVPFSWFSERLRGPGSPKNSQSRAFPTGSGEDGESSVALLDDCITTHQSSRPHHTHAHEEQDGGHDTDFGFRKKMLSAAGKERPERQNGVHGKRDGEEGQQLLST